MTNKMQVEVVRVFSHTYIMELEEYATLKLFSAAEIREYECNEADGVSLMLESDGNAITLLDTGVSFIHSDPDVLLQDTEEEIEDEDELPEESASPGSVH